MIKPLTYTFPGEPRTKKNSQEIRYKGVRCPTCHKGRIPFVSPSKAFLDYQKRALWSLTGRARPCLIGPVSVKCVFYMGTRRKIDLVNLLEAVDDILVAGEILSDDNSRVIVSHDGSRVLYDKENPRVEIEITEVGNEK